MDIEFALIELAELTDDCKHKCKVCGHTLKYISSIWHHIEWKHEDEVRKLTGGQVHGVSSWNK